MDTLVTSASPITAVSTTFERNDESAAIRGHRGLTVLATETEKHATRVISWTAHPNPLGKAINHIRVPVQHEHWTT
jgi:hypothetical protein